MQYMLPNIINYKFNNKNCSISCIKSLHRLWSIFYYFVNCLIYISMAIWIISSIIGLYGAYRNVPLCFKYY